MSSKKACHVFLGAAGVGKGTFAKLICQQKGWSHVSTGDLLRKEVDEKTQLGMECQTIMNQGRLVSDALVNQLVTKALQKAPDSVILDGFPRTVDQAKALSRDLQNWPFSLQATHITLHRDVIMRKLLGRRLCLECGGNFNVADVMEDGFDMPAILPTASSCRHFNTRKCVDESYFKKRDDDTEDAIRRRLDDYDRNIGPLLDYYRARGELKSFAVKKGVKDTDALLQHMLS